MQGKHLFSFGPFHLDIANRQLLRGQRELKLTGRAFGVLVYLAERPGQLVTKDELFGEIWQETVVGDAALAVCIRELRKTLKDKTRTPQFIETVHGQGYRFVAEVRSEWSEGESRGFRRNGGGRGHKDELGKHGSMNVATHTLVDTVQSEPPVTISPTANQERAGPSRVNIQGLQQRWRKVITAIVAVVVVGAALAVLRNTYQQPVSRSVEALSEDGAALPLPDKPSIAVLPFTNMSGDPDQEYFSDGITETLITDLSMIPGLFVIARSSTFTYKGKAVRVEQVGQELGVHYVMEGSVQKTGKRVRINAQLVDAISGGHIWAERYDRKLDDIFSLQDEIVLRIIRTLEIQLPLMEQGLPVQRDTDSFEAYEATLRGHAYIYQATQAANILAQQMYEQAIALAPKFAEAYIGLGWVRFRDWYFQWGPGPRAKDEAVQLVQKALALNSSDASAHELLGYIYLWEKQHAQAISELEQALVLSPSYASAYATLAEILNFAGRPQEAIVLMEKAIRLNPRHPYYYLFTLGQAYRLAERYEDAIATHKRALAFNPNYLYVYLDLAAIYGEQGRQEEARAVAAKVLEISPTYSLEVAKQRMPYKDPKELERFLAGLRKAGLQ